MKICIIGLPRCGTTALFHFIKNHLSEEYTCISEPWNKTRNVEITDNCFYKLVVNDTVAIKLNPNETIFDLCNELINGFDKIIFLRRRNMDGAIKSLSHQLLYRYELLDNRDDFAHDYYERWIPIFDEITKNKKVYYYEDIYQDKISNSILEICDYLNIELDKKIFDEVVHIKNRHPFSRPKTNLI